MEENAPRTEVLFSDLAAMLAPADAITADWRRDTWRCHSYETSKIKGTLVATTERQRVPPLTFSPKLRGWYRVYLGMFHANLGGESRFYISFTGDEAPTRVGSDKTLAAYTIDEFLVRCEDMTDKEITFSQDTGAILCSAALAFVRFVPMTNDEVTKLQRDREDSSHRRLYATEDMHGCFIRGPEGMGDFLSLLEPYRHSDVGVVALEWQGWFDWYASDRLPEGRLLARRYEEEAERATREFRKKGLDAHRAMIDHGHKMGLRMHLSMRMGAWGDEFPLDINFNCPFFNEHPELYMKDRDGETVSRLSFAYPEARAFIADTLSRMAEYDCDGIDLLFNRGYPFILFEEPFLERMREKYGVDARRLPNDDERIMTERGLIITDFLKELRLRIDRERAARGQAPIRITAHVHKTLAACRFVGLDLAAWAREHVVDAVACYPLEHFDALPDFVYTDETHTEVDVDAYRRAVVEGPENFKWGHYDLCYGYSGVRYDTTVDDENEVRLLTDTLRGSGIKLYIHIMPRNMGAEKLLKRSALLYAWGADGIGLWDTECRATRTREWTVMSRLGHKEELIAYDPYDGVRYRNHNIVKLGAHRIDRYAPHWGL